MMERSERHQQLQHEQWPLRPCERLNQGSGVLQSSAWSFPVWCRLAARRTVTTPAVNTDSVIPAARKPLLSLLAACILMVKLEQRTVIDGRSALCARQPAKNGHLWTRVLTVLDEGKCMQQQKGGNHNSTLTKMELVGPLLKPVLDEGSIRAALNT